VNCALCKRFKSSHQVGRARGMGCQFHGFYA
jgi:hypothetical protein